MELNRKRFAILGDSYSTFLGHIPSHYSPYYPRPEAVPDVLRVEDTWWHRLAESTGMTLTVNDSYSGSTVCNTIREGLPAESSFVRRMDNYLAENFFAEHNIETMFLFGGTNDSWIDAPIGRNKYADRTQEDLMYVLPAFCALIEQAKAAVKELIVVINTELKYEITDGIMKACEKNDVKYVLLKEIDKEGGHPTELGMRQICDQIKVCLG